MSGILDNKSRVLDVIITPEGRKSLANGGLDISFATFTDAACFYEADALSGSSDATTRIYLECSALPQDDITFKADDSGKLMPFNSQVTSKLKAGQLLTYSFTAFSSSFITGSSDTVEILKNEEFASEIDSILNSSADNFKKLYVIGTHDPIFDDGFGVGPENVTFVANKSIPVALNKRQKAFEALEELFTDVRLSKLPNFSYLPPISKTDNNAVDKSDPASTRPYWLGMYAAAGSTTELTGDTIKSELAQFESVGLMKEISIDPSSRKNTLLAQFFEIGSSIASKMDVIDFGRVSIDGQQKHVFFVGKVLLNNVGSQKFVHIFTMVFE